MAFVEQHVTGVHSEEYGKNKGHSHYIGWRQSLVGWRPSLLGIVRTRDKESRDKFFVMDSKRKQDAFLRRAQHTGCNIDQGS